MKYCFLVLWLLFASAACGIDRNAFTFTDYKLNVRVEPQQQRLGVRGRITLRNDSGIAQKNAVLQISSSLAWRSIQVDGKPVQFVSQPYTSDIDHTGAVSEAIVTLPTAVPPKGTVDLEIGYEGVIPLDTTRLKRIGVPDDVAKHSDWDQISPSFTAVRGIGYVAWYPVAMDAANLSEADSEFDLVSAWKRRQQQAIAEINLCLVSDNPALVSLMNDQTPATNVSSRTRETSEDCHKHEFTRLAMTVPAFTIGPFHKLAASGAEISYAADAESAARNYASAAGRVAPFITQWFGKPRPSMNIVQLADSGAVPFETGSIMFTPFSSDTRLAEITLAHALTHAAFPSPRPWIYEGTAHFAQALWREHVAGRQAALDFMGLHRTALEKVEQNPSSTAPSLIATTDDEQYRSKAMFVWWMLRDMIGEPPLTKAFASYHAPDDRDPAYLPRLVQAQTSRNLDWFFDDWVYHDRGLPDFRVASVYPSKTPRGIYLVTVTIENLGNAGAEVPFTVRFNDGEVTKRLEVRAKAHATTRVEVPAMPTEVVVNDGSVPESDTVNNTFTLGATDAKEIQLP